MMKYCVECGTKLEMKYLENEGDIPYCPKCEAHRFPIFNTAVSMIVIDKGSKKILLIKQYGRPFFILVAGYVNRGESCEEALAREISEEVGLTVTDWQFNKSKFYEGSNTLMVNFAAFVDSTEVNCNKEIDSYQWFSFDEARKNIKEGSLAEEFLCAFLDKQQN